MEGIILNDKKNDDSLDDKRIFEAEDEMSNIKFKEDSIYCK